MRNEVPGLGMGMRPQTGNGKWKLKPGNEDWEAKAVCLPWGLQGVQFHCRGDTSPGDIFWYILPPDSLLGVVGRAWVRMVGHCGGRRMKGRREERREEERRGGKKGEEGRKERREERRSGKKGEVRENKERETSIGGREEREG